MIDTAKTLTMDVAGQLEGQSLNAVVAGFSFASAIAWMDVVRALVAMVVRSNRQTPTEAAVKSFLRSMGTTLGREIMRGILGVVKKR